jgi:1-acyl-sn-glycerol-3-phosphate acyltransferase
MQVLRSLLLATWFNGCCVCIAVTQLVGAPLYFINKDYFYAYMAMTKQCFGILIITVTNWGAPTLVRVSGDESVSGQLRLAPDGRLKTEFPDRLVFIANHQVYTDWLYLWWVTYTSRMHGHIYIILKESLKYIPILGPGMMFYGFIFMARKWESDKPRLQHRLEKLKARHSGPMSGSQLLDPMWLLIFPEGTNLSINTKRISDQYGEKTSIPPLKHMILPRSTGLYFCLQQLKGTVDWVYDCTIGYEGPP